MSLRGGRWSSRRYSSAVPRPARRSNPQLNYEIASSFHSSQWRYCFFRWLWI